MMRKIYKYSLLATILGLLVLTACTDEYEAPNSFSDVSWAQSFEPGNTWHVNIDEFVAFMDLSQGTLSHEWSIEEGNHFLDNGFEQGDTLDYFINKEKGLSTSDATVNVLFKNAGLNKIRLHNTFSEPVKYQYTVRDEEGNNVIVPVHSVEKGGAHVFDTTFVVDVYGEFKAKYAVVFKTDTILKITEEDLVDINDTANWKQVELEAGQSLELIDFTTVGRPSKRNWVFGSGNPSTIEDSAAVVSFYSLGRSKGFVDYSRAYPQPTAYKRFDIPLWVNVSASNEPFVISGDITENIDGIVSFKVTGEVTELINEESNFTVTVKNTDTGFDETIDVVSATINALDATIIDLKLQSPIYNNDEVIVAYAGGNIVSIDQRVLSAFTAQQAITYQKPSLFLDDAWGFEIPSTAQDGGADKWWFWQGFARSEDKGYLGSNASLKFEHTAGSNIDARALRSGFSAPEGQYRFSFYAFIEDGSDMANVELKTIWDPTWQQITIPLNTVAAGEWVLVEEILNFSGERNDFNFRFFDAGGAGDVVVYIDDVRLYPLTVRE